jgi:hypothetical protein
MPKPPRPPEELLKICNRWSEAVEGIAGNAARMKYFQNELSGFLRNQAVFEKLLRNMKNGSPYPDLRQAQMIDDEILLYLNPRRLFSLRMFLYGPGDYTPIHDHSSWGVSGAAVGELGVIPLNEGIHQTGNPVDGTTIMISIYGSPIRRPYINRFDYKANTVEKVYPPRIRKKMLAIEALKQLNK